MSRGKQAKGVQWALNQKKRDAESLKATKEVKEEPVSEEEKARRIAALKAMGLIK